MSFRKLNVKDDDTWLFIYRKPIREQLHEVGVPEATSPAFEKIQNFLSVV